MSVDLVIYRYPDLNGEMRFAEVDYADGKLGKEGAIFSITEENDNYKEMRFDHIVLASRVPGGSRDLIRFALNDDDGEPAKVFMIGFPTLSTIVEHLVEEYRRSLN